MAKKGVVIFDGEDMFINPKKAIYSKTRGEAKSNSFVSIRGEDGPEEAESPIGRERIVPQETTSGGSGGSQVTQPTPIVTEPQPTVVQQSESLSKQKGVEPDAPITVSAPKAEVPTIVVPPILPPTYLAPVPETPQRPSRPGVREDDFLEKRPISDGSGGRYSGDENNPRNNTTPIYTIDDGTPAKPVVDTPKYVAPVPALPELKAPPAAVIIADPLGGGGSPILTKDPEVPKLKCPEGFVLGPGGECVPTKKTIDEEIKKIDTSSTTTTTTKAKAKDADEILTPATSSTTTTTTKKPDDKVAETTTSTTTTTTTKKSKNCNPPIYAAPKYYKWVDKGNCTFELAVDDTQIKNPSPAPVLPAAAGQPIININLPTGGLGTVPTTSTIVQTTTLAKPSGGGASGGGGGGTPFPEEPAPIVQEVKKNYFWWYVGGALAIMLLIKRKKSQ